MTFDQALKKLPACIRGLDLLGQHRSTADLAFLVQHEIDMWDENDASDIRTIQQYWACKRYLDKLP